MPDNSGNGNVAVKIDLAVLQELFKKTGEELNKLDNKVENLRKEIIDTKDEIKDEIADMRGDIKVLYFKVSAFAIGAGSVASAVVATIIKLSG